MIAYNKIWLTNFRLQKTVKSDLQKGYISNVEFKTIVEKYPVGFYMPGVFARVGLFILTCIVVLFASGLVALMADRSNIIGSPGFIIFLGLLSYPALEVMIAVKHHYRSGVDDALLFISGCLFLIAFCMMFSDSANGINYWAISAISFILSLVFSIRFSDMLMSAACCVAFVAFVFFGWTRIVPSGLTTVPFIIMLASALVYWMAKTCTKRAIFINYKNCLVTVQIISLLVLYAAGNYYIIQTLSTELNGTNSKAIPFGAFFWAWTVLLPFIYVLFAIKRKDVILLRTGLILITAAAITFRNYYHILPTAISLIIAGAIILGIAYTIMKYLKIPKYGFTYAAPDEAHILDHLNVESLIVAETFSTAPSAPSNDGVKFGGGDFSGGGSSSGF